MKLRSARMLAGHDQRLASRIATETIEASASEGGADSPDGRARGRHHDQLAVAVHPVEGVERRHQHRVRRDQRHQARQAEHGHLQEQHDALSLRGDEIRFFQGCSEPDDERQGQQNDEERIRHLPKHVSAEERHGRSAKVPRLAPWPIGSSSHANPLVPKTILISLRWRNFGLFGMACFPSRQDLRRAAVISLPLLQDCISKPFRPSAVCGAFLAIA